MKKIFVALVLTLMIVVPLVSAQASTLTGPMPCSQTIVGVTPFDNRIVKYFDLKRQIFFGQQGFEFPCDQVVKNTLYEVNGLLNCDDFGTSCTTNADCDPLDNLPNDDFVCVNDRCLETCTVDGDCSAEGSCELFPDDENYCVDLCSNGDFNPYDPSCCCTLQENFNNELNDPALLKQLTQEDRDIVLPGILEDLQDDLNCLVEVASPLCSNGLDDDGDGDIDCADSDCINANTQCVPEHNSESSDVENGQIGLALSSQLYFNKFKPCAARAIKGLGVLEQIYSKTSGAFFIVQKLEELETELIHKLALNDENAQKFFQVNQFTCNTQPVNSWTSNVKTLNALFNECQQLAPFWADVAAECGMTFGGGGPIDDVDTNFVTPEEQCLQDALVFKMNEFNKFISDPTDDIGGNVPTFPTSSFPPVFPHVLTPPFDNADQQNKLIAANILQGTSIANWVIGCFAISGTETEAIDCIKQNCQKGPAQPFCGNGIVEVSEQCDTGGPCCTSCRFAAQFTRGTDDGNDCTQDICDAVGVTMHLFLGASTPCPCFDDSFGHCDGAGTCTCPGVPPPVGQPPSEIELVPTAVTPDVGFDEYTLNVNDLQGVGFVLNEEAALKITTAGAGLPTISIPGAILSSSQSNAVNGQVIFGASYTLPEGATYPVTIKVPKTDNTVVTVSVQATQQTTKNFGGRTSLFGSTAIPWKTATLACPPVLFEAQQPAIGTLAQGFDVGATTVTSPGVGSITFEIVFDKDSVTDGWFGALTPPVGVTVPHAPFFSCGAPIPLSVGLAEFTLWGYTGPVTAGTVYRPTVLSPGAGASDGKAVISVDLPNSNLQNTQNAFVFNDAAGSLTLGSITGAAVFGELENSPGGIAALAIAALIVIGIFVFVLRRRP